MRWLLRYVFPLLVVLPVGLLLLYPQLLRCMRIGQSAEFGQMPGTDAVFVSHAASRPERQRLAEHLRTARLRIRQFWGDQRGHATLIYCPQQAIYEQYCAGGEGAGCSLGLPWGASYLVLGPDGNNTDVIAHELCHDELFARLGWWTVKKQIPQWFNEGLALMLDYRFSNPAVWENAGKTSPSDPAFDDDQMPFAPGTMLKLSDLETTRDFFAGDYGRVILAYQTSADEVARWLAVVGRAGVPALTDSVVKGVPFGEAYRQLEQQHRSRHRR